MSTRIARYCRLVAVVVAVSPWAAAFGADTFSTSDSTAGQPQLAANSPCVPQPGPCYQGQGSGGAGLQGAPSGSRNEPSTSPNLSLFGGEQIGGTGGGMVAVSDAPGGYIDNAIVGNVLRFRTDLAFDDENSDMAEFIYAECACQSPLARGPGPGPGKGPVPNLDVALTKINYQELSGYMELSASERFSAFMELPVRFIQFKQVTGLPDDASEFNNGGVGDLNVGFKFALIHDADQYLTAQLRAYLPTGNSYQGLGTGHLSLEPALLYWRRVSERLCIQAELRDWIPIDGDVLPDGSDFAGNVLRYGFGAGYDLITPGCSENCWGGRPMRLTAVTEVVGWDVFGGQFSLNSSSTGAAVADASGTSIVNLKIGARLTCGQNSLYAGWGHALTEQAWYRDIARIELCHAF